MDRTEPYALTSPRFWHSYLVTMRPYLLFVSGAAGLVGLAFIDEPSLFRASLASIPLFLSYGLGQALTDCFQTDTDAISSPYRPLVRGLISPKQVLSVSLTGLIVCALLLGYLNPWLLLVGLFAVFGLLTYTYFKRTWWGGPPWNSWIVALLPVMGRMVDRERGIGSLLNLAPLFARICNPSAYMARVGITGVLRTPSPSGHFGDPHSLAFLLSVAMVFFAYANFVVMGYFKDISADRETGYHTFPVVFGWQPAAVYSDLTALAAAGLAGWALLLIGSVNLWAGLVYCAAAAMNLYAQIRIHRIGDEKETHGPIENVVRAFVLYCLAIVVALKLHWLVLVVVFYVLFELALKARPEEAQV